MTTQNNEYDAAQALLDLQGTVKQENPETYMHRSSNSREDMEKTAKLFWNCFISSEIPVVSVSTSNISESFTRSEEQSNKEFSIASKPFVPINKHKRKRLPELNIAKHYRNFDTRHFNGDHVSTVTESHPQRQNPQSMQLFDTFQSCNLKNTTKTREISTQTEESYFNPNIEFMEVTIKKLYEKIQSLEAQLNHNSSEQHSVFGSSENEDPQSNESHRSIDYNTSVNESVGNGYKRVNFSKTIRFEDSREFTQDKPSNTFSNKVITNHNSYSKMNDLIPIGEGHATVPARLLKHINWSSYTSATRKLLTAVFSRRILATHSLTGKPSPAFPNKPAKKRLNPALVNDIVQTVVERCSVPENVVRTSITTKCADESKMFKTRQSNKTSKSSKKNCENVPPTSSESDSEEY